MSLYSHYYLKWGGGVISRTWSNGEVSVPVCNLHLIISSNIFAQS